MMVCKLRKNLKKKIKFKKKLTYRTKKLKQRKLFNKNLSQEEKCKIIRREKNFFNGQNNSNYFLEMKNRQKILIKKCLNFVKLA